MKKIKKYLKDIEFMKTNNTVCQFVLYIKKIMLNRAKAHFQAKLTGQFSVVIRLRMKKKIKKIKRYDLSKQKLWLEFIKKYIYSVGGYT